MGFIDFTNGEVLTADQMDTVLRQSVMRFADATARDTALSAVLAEGLMCYLDDTDEVLKYDGSSWISISGDITGVTAGTALTGGGTSGNVTLDVDETALTIAQSQVTDLTTDLAGKQNDVITTQGDLVIGDASGGPVRLPVGSADQVLTSDGTTLSFQDAGGGGGGLTQRQEIFSSNSSYDVSGIEGFARFTAIAAGGGACTGFSTSASSGGNTSVTISGGTNTAVGGQGGVTNNISAPQIQRFCSDNGGIAPSAGDNSRIVAYGQGGSISIFYADLTGVSTIDISIGSGGSGNGTYAGNGASGLVILESA